MLICLLSVWFLANKDVNGELDESGFYGCAIERLGANALRTPVYPEMGEIVNHELAEFSSHRFKRASITEHFCAYAFTNGRSTTKSRLIKYASVGR